MTAPLTNTTVGNSLAHGHSPSDPAPFTTTRPAVSLPTSRTARRSSRAHHPDRDSRTAILDAASSLIADGGFVAATTRNIAELTGMASGAVERQFGSHDDLLAAVFQRLAATELAAVDHASRIHGSTATERLTALVGAFATRALHGRHTAEALLFEPVGARVNQERLTCRRQYHALIVGINSAAALPRLRRRTGMRLPRRRWSRYPARDAALLLPEVGDGDVGPTRGRARTRPCTLGLSQAAAGRSPRRTGRPTRSAQHQSRRHPSRCPWTGLEPLAAHRYRPHLVGLAADPQCAVASRRTLRILRLHTQRAALRRGRH